MTRKSAEHLRTIYGNTGQLFRPYEVSSAVYTVISTTGDRTSDHRLQWWNWATGSYRLKVTSNQLIMLIARPNNLNVFCKLHPNTFQRTRSPPPRPCLPMKLRNTHLRNYYGLRGKGMKFLFKLIIGASEKMVSSLICTVTKNEKNTVENKTKMLEINNTKSLVIKPYFVKLIFKLSTRYIMKIIFLLVKYNTRGRVKRIQ